MHGISHHLRQSRIAFELLLHRPAATASQRAETLHLPGRSVAKSVLLALGDQYILAVLPATHRIELERLRALFNTTELRLATEDDLERVFYDCERGAVPALGSLYGLTTLIDSSLAGSAEIIFDGNARHESVKVRFRDFESLEKPRRERFAAWVTPPRTRRAG